MSAFLTARRSALVLAGSLVLAACGGGGDGGSPLMPIPPTPPAPYATCSPAGVAASNQSKATVTVCMLTTEGEIVIALDRVKAPVTVDNFLKYVDNKHYDNTLYHRVIRDFVIQGGGFAASGAGFTTLPAAPKPTAFPPIALESNNGLRNLRGTIAMARLQEPNSATAQFFVNTVDNPCLNVSNGCANADQNGYAVFGQVIAGIEVIDRIKAVTVGAGDQPTRDVVTYWAQKLKG